MNDIRAAAQEAELFVDTYSPGDGVTRYRFFLWDGLADGQNYFGPGNGIYTALGRKEALVWLAGYARGRYGR